MMFVLYIDTILVDYLFEIVFYEFFYKETSKISYFKELKVLVVRPQVKDAGKDSTLAETYWNFIFVLKRQATQNL